MKILGCFVLKSSDLMLYSHSDLNVKEDLMGNFISALIQFSSTLGGTVQDIKFKGFCLTMFNMDTIQFGLIVEKPLSDSETEKCRQVLSRLYEKYKSVLDEIGKENEGESKILSDVFLKFEDELQELLGLSEKEHMDVSDWRHRLNHYFDAF